MSWSFFLKKIKSHQFLLFFDEKPTGIKLLKRENPSDMRNASTVLRIANTLKMKILRVRKNLKTKKVRYFDT